MACFHCGEPIPRGFNATIHYENQEYLVCCYGCQAVAQTIIDSGSSAYYLQREDYTSKPSFWDMDELKILGQEISLTPTQGELIYAELSITNMTCPACVWLINRHLSKLNNIAEQRIDLEHHRVHIAWHAKSNISLPFILEHLQKIGYKATPFSPDHEAVQTAKEQKKLWARWAWSTISMMQVMMFTIPIYLASPGEIEEVFLRMMHWASLILTLPVACYSSISFYQDSLREWKAKQPGMNTPITLGITATFFGSLVALWHHQYNRIYFDAISMFVFFMLSARLIEVYAKKRAYQASLADEHLIPLSTQYAEHYPDQRITTVLRSSLIKPGMILFCSAGSRIPCDGIVIEGKSTCDESLLSGEQSPIFKNIGDLVWGGSLNQTSGLWIESQASCQESRVGQWKMQMRQSTQMHTNEHHGLTQQIGHYFSWFLLICSICCAIFWYMNNEKDAAFWNTIAVLIVSCPCALVLAVPTAQSAALFALSRKGLLLRHAKDLDTLGSITDITFDKTGTITDHQLILKHVDSKHDAMMMLRIAAAMEHYHQQNHPIAQALINACPQDASWNTIVSHIEKGLIHPQQGLSVYYDSQYWQLGRPSWVQDVPNHHWILKPSNQSPQKTYESFVLLSCDGNVMASFSLEHRIRNGIAKSIYLLKQQDIRSHILSGDEPQAVQIIGHHLGIDHAYGQHQPEDKKNYVLHLQNSGKKVWMIGDGANDGLSLTQASFSTSMRHGVDIAKSYAHSIWIFDHFEYLHEIPKILRLMKRITRENLAWAGLYNAIMIPLAAFGYLTPWLAGLSMAISSLLVVLNALRLMKVSI